MSQPVAAIKQKSKDHRHRKNPRSAELAAEARHKTNAARGKQRWVQPLRDHLTGDVVMAGYWERI